MKLALLVPTRNRPDRLSIVLKSLLSNASPHCRVIVSDNSDLIHRSETKGVVSACQIDHIQYIAPPSVLSMGAHWQWALKQVDGDYIGYVTDRMPWRRNTMTHAIATLEGLKPECLCYTQFALAGDPGAYHISPVRYTGSVTPIETSWAADNAANMHHPINMPCMLNSLTRMDVVQRMTERYGNFMDSAVGDISFAMHFLDTCKTFHYWDFPINLAYGFGVGHGVASGINDQSTLDFISRIYSAGGLTNSPLPSIITNINIRTNEYLRVAKIQKSGRFPALNLENYYLAMKQELSAQEHLHPNDAFALLEDFRNSSNLQIESTSSLPTSFRKRIKASSAWSSIEPFFVKLFEHTGWNPATVPYGTFSTVEEALDFDALHPPLRNRKGRSDIFWN